MRDHQRRALSQHPARDLLQGLLRLRVHGGSCFVQDEDRWIMAQRASERQKLSLAGGKPSTALPHQRIHAVGETIDKFAQSDILQKLAYAFPRNLAAQRDVLEDASRKEVWVLEDDPQ